MIIREAQEADILPLATFLIEQFHGRYTDRFPPVNIHKTMKVVYFVATQGVAFIAEKDGKIVGSLGVTEADHWFSDETFLADQWLFVAPESRASRAAVMLLKAYQSYASRKGLPAVISAITGEDVERKDRLFERFGFRRLGGYYRWEG